jgi:quercetin dioxygenase-like cupin family protein
MVCIKNIPQKEPLALASLVDVVEGQVVSRTLAQSGNVSITVFAFDKGEEISTHESHGDAMVTVLEGTGRFTIDGTPFILKAGQTIVMPANRPHAVFGEERFKMILTVVFPIV